MPRKKDPSNLPPDWHEHFLATANGRTITPGTEVSIKGERGRFRFIKRVERDCGYEWLDFWGGPKGCESWRSFSADRVKRVHRIGKTDKSVLEARRAAA